MQGFDVDRRRSQQVEEAEASLIKQRKSDWKTGASTSGLTPLASTQRYVSNLRDGRHILRLHQFMPDPLVDSLSGCGWIQSNLIVRAGIRREDSKTV